MTTFQDAAASYFGLADTGVRKTEVFTHEGEMLVVFEVPLTTEDVLGIADRMRAMGDQPAPQATIAPPVSREDMRAAYSALSPAERSQYGSFAKYVALGGGADPFAPVGAEELRAAYVDQTVAAMQRLNGADGKPTSNADDFGGVPG